jgi:hypothetical protein
MGAPLLTKVAGGAVDLARCAIERVDDGVFRRAD